MKSWFNLGIILPVIVTGQLLLKPPPLFGEMESEKAGIQRTIEEIDTLIEGREFEKAAMMSESALQKAGRKFGKDSPMAACLLHCLGKCRYAQEDYSECETIWERVRGIRENKLGPEHADVAQILNDLGNLYFMRGKYDAVEPTLQRALAIREKVLGPEHPDVAESINDLANLYWLKGQYKLAEALHRRALDIREKAFGPQHPEVAESMTHLGRVYRELGEIEGAQHLYNQALTIRKNILGSGHPEVAESLNALADFYLGEKHDYIKAESLFKQALSIQEKVLGPNHSSIAETLKGLGVLCCAQGKLTEGEMLYKRALAIREKILGPDHLLIAKILNNLAVLYMIQGQFPEAEKDMKRVLSIQENALGPYHSDIIKTLHNLATLHGAQGKLAEAEANYKKVLPMAIKTMGADDPIVARTMDCLGAIYEAQGKSVEAVSLHQQALTIGEEALGPSHPDVAILLDNLAGIYLKQGKYAEAESLLKRALAIGEAALGPGHYHVAHWLNNTALLYGSSGQWEKCLHYFNKLQESRQHFIESIFAHASEDQKMNYLDKYPLISHTLLSLAIMANDAEAKDDRRETAISNKTAFINAALEMALKSKAVVIDALTAERQIAYSSYSDEIQVKVKEHHKVCGEIATLTLAGQKYIDRKTDRARMQSLYQIKNNLEAELSSRCAEFMDELAARRFNIRDVAIVIPEEGILWEFMKYEPCDFQTGAGETEKTKLARYIAFTLNREGNITLTDLGDAEEIDRLIHSAREAIYKARDLVHSPRVFDSEKQLRESTGKLYQIVFAPLAELSGHKKDIYIAADGQLNLLPFEIFPCPDGRYVIENYRISYLASGRDLLRLKKKKQKSNDWAMVLSHPDYDLSAETLSKGKNKILKGRAVSSSLGMPSRGVSECFDSRFISLPYSREETEFVTKALQMKAGLETRSYCCGDALEDVLKAMPTAPSVLHLTTHGFFCEDLDLFKGEKIENPLLRAGLALAGANHLMDENLERSSAMEDGILTAFEASGLNLIGTDLVTLSACETGIGEVKNGEGVLGLRRAFQHAGARTIIMSLWRVPDKDTCELMSYFYETWSAGESKKEALRQSALKVLNSRRDRHAAHPYFWGAFVLLGDPN